MLAWQHVRLKGKQPPRAHSHAQGAIHTDPNLLDATPGVRRTVYGQMAACLAALHNAPVGQLGLQRFGDPRVRLGCIRGKKVKQGHALVEGGSQRAASGMHANQGRLCRGTRSSCEGGTPISALS